jgi:hypothetical protein
MSRESKLWKQYAYLVLSLHVLFTLFMLITPLLIYIGMLQSWNWINNIGFRHIHIFLLIFVMIEVYLDHPCIFTVWENRYREKAGMAMYCSGFFDFWVAHLLGLSLKKWVFNLIFGSLAIITFIEYYFFLMRL